MKAATRLQAIREDWDERASASSTKRSPTTASSGRSSSARSTRPENPLPPAIKQNIANLGIFIFNHTLALMTRAERRSGSAS